MGRKDEYKYENTENYQKVQTIRGKHKMHACRPFLYLQDEGEIVKIKMIGKRWIFIGAKLENEDDGTTGGHITVWERQIKKPRLKMYMSQVCLDGRFWIKTTADG